MPKKIYQALTLPTEDITTPVCVGDLPSFDYKVSVSALTEDIGTALSNSKINST